MNKQSQTLYHIGGEILTDTSVLLKKHDYHYVTIDKNFKDTFSKILLSDGIHKSNSSNLYLLSKEVMNHLDNNSLTKLPSHQIFYETLDQATDETIRILKIKGAIQVNTYNSEEFLSFINHNYSKPWGSSLDNRRIEVHPDFEGIVTKKGAGRISLEGEFGEENFQQVILWKNSWNCSGKVKFYPEIKVSDKVQYFWRVYFKKNKDSSLIDIVDFTSEQIKKEQVRLDLGRSEFPVNLGLFLKGKGKVTVGDLHIRYDLYEDNFLAMGGRRLVQKNNLGEELGVYFNAGDLKPPLNVYFSGFRPSEGYEGRWMMGSLDSPFILVYDPRIVGGAFYRGQELEENLIEFIQEKMKLLEFSKDELILSGLSMGTYASFYFGSKLEPHAIIVGKPLANIGDLAKNSRIFAPYEWDLAMDTLINITGDLTSESAELLDRDFWELFECANFSETKFIIVHMLDDTDRPFERIFNHLKLNYPSSNILHKGLRGRHNDNTPGVTTWFYKQFQQILISDFERGNINN